MNVLILAAHPDDELLGCGGTVARHVDDGDHVAALIVADCASARDPSVAPTLPPAAVLAAGALGGVELVFGGLHGLSLAQEARFVRLAVEGAVRVFAPEVVYTHSPIDLNSDHRAVAEAALVACRPIGARFPRRVLAFETPSSTEWSSGGFFAPQVFVDISTTIERKLAAMACYSAELREPPHPRGLDALRARAAYWGQVSGCRYAESFSLVREVWR